MERRRRRGRSPAGSACYQSDDDGCGGDGEEEECALPQPGFLEAIREIACRRDYAAVLAFCDRHLLSSSCDQYALQLRQKVRDQLDSPRTRRSSAPGAAPKRKSSPAPGMPPLPTSGPPQEESKPLATLSLADLKVRARTAVAAAFEAMYRALEDDAALWYMGEQAVGIFVDAWQLQPPGSFRDRLFEMSRSLLERVLRRARNSGWVCGATRWELPDHCTFEHWLFEALGLLWWQVELGMEMDQHLFTNARKELDRLANKRALVGCSKEHLPAASLASLYSRLMEVWMLERCYVCGLFGEPPPEGDAAGGGLPPLEYGVADVLAEIRRRPLPEVATEEFGEAFYLMTHVVYVMNGYNSCLPNNREDCPWVYNYLEKSLAFCLQEGQYLAAGDFYSLYLDPDGWGAEAVDMAAEAADILIGLGECEDDAKEEPEEVPVVTPMVHPPTSTAANAGAKAGAKAATKASAKASGSSTAKVQQQQQQRQKQQQQQQQQQEQQRRKRHEVVQEAILFLLSQQQDDGLFSSPGAVLCCDDVYDRLHPTWAAVAALHLDRAQGPANERSARWTAYVREGAQRVGFAEAPPPLPKCGVVEDHLNLATLADASRRRMARARDGDGGRAWWPGRAGYS